MAIERASSLARVLGVGPESLRPPQARVDARTLQTGWGPSSATGSEAAAPSGVRPFEAAHALELDPDTAEIGRWRMIAEVKELASAGFSPAAQQAFVDAMSRTMPPPRHAKEAARVGGVAEVLEAVRRGARGIAPERLGIIREFFRQRGFERLLPTDQVTPGKDGALTYQLDRVTFGKVLSDPSRGLEAKVLLEKTVDREDLRFAQLLIKRKLEDHEVNPRLGRALLSDLGQRLGTTVHFVEVAKAFKVMRGGADTPLEERFSNERVDDFKALIADSVDDDTLHLAERLVLGHRDYSAKDDRPWVDGALVKLIRDTNDPKERARLEAVKADLTTFFAERTRGKVDHYGEDRERRRLLARGEISEGEYRAARVAIFASDTPEELAVALSLNLSSALFQMQYEVFHDLMKAWADSLSNDELDSEGRVIETAEERLQRLARISLVAMHITTPERVAYFGKRSALCAAFESARDRLASATTHGERDACLGDFCASLSGLDEVARPLTA